MNPITRFEIRKLHGYKNLDLDFKDNTLILVGENGAGKTTVLHLLFYLLSGQWSSMTKYKFEYVALSIGKKRYQLTHADLDQMLVGIDQRYLSHLPPPVRRRIIALIDEQEGMLFTPELEMLCRDYGVPLSYLFEAVDTFQHGAGKATKALQRTLKQITDSLTTQLLYLPTYRRIEQELSLIFKGLDERELRQRRELLTARRGNNTFVELIEFGMKDVEKAIEGRLSELNKFARENLNNLTFGYLGDVVEQQYSNVDFDRIRNATEQTIAKILNRIQEHVLSSENKQHLQKIIEGVKTDEKQTEHTKVICHYFTKLMGFQEDLERKEEQITRFCAACNEYMVDKEFKYDISKFVFTIQPKGVRNAPAEVKLHHLSSGEKQIVSLFSHLYLSGGKSYFVLIDEPELSLSVPWQRKFLLDIRNADLCAGLVAVTHSPFIYDNDLRKYAHGLGEFVV